MTNGWNIQQVTAVGTTSSGAPTITRDSPHVLVELTTATGQTAVNLSSSPVNGDLVEIYNVGTVNGMIFPVTIAIGGSHIQYYRWSSANSAWVSNT